MLLFSLGILKLTQINIFRNEFISLRLLKNFLAISKGIESLPLRARVIRRRQSFLFQPRSQLPETLNKAENGSEKPR